MKQNSFQKCHSNRSLVPSSMLFQQYLGLDVNLKLRITSDMQRENQGKEMNLKDLRAFESYIKPDNSTVIFKHISSLTENFYRENTWYKVALGHSKNYFTIFRSQYKPFSRGTDRVYFYINRQTLPLRCFHNLEFSFP